MPIKEARTYKFTQATPSTTWVITHNLGTVTPIVDCFTTVNGDFQKIIPLSVVATSNLVVTVTWSTARSGSAVVV